MKTETEPKVYVACLGCYNEGRHHGRWINADELEERWDDMQIHGNPAPRYPEQSYPMTKCKRLHHEEWAIHDYDGVPNLGEHPDTPYLIKVMRAIEWQHQQGDGEAFLEWFNLDPHNKSHHDDLSEAFEEAYCGEWDSPKDFAEQMAEDCGYLPSADAKNPNPLFRFVDFDWWWQSDLRHNYDYIGGFVFRSDV